MGYRPEGTSLGRIDNNKGYCKENCRWETPKQQMRNPAVTIGINGESAVSIAENIGIKPGTVTTRLKRGWSEDDAVNTPVNDNSNCITRKAIALGLDAGVIISRITRGWSEEKALTTPIKKRKSLKDISQKCGIRSDILSNRLLRGWSLDRATTQEVR